MVLFVPHKNCNRVISPKALNPSSGKLLGNHHINTYHNNSFAHNSWSKHSPESYLVNTGLAIQGLESQGPGNSTTKWSRVDLWNPRVKIVRSRLSDLRRPDLVDKVPKTHRHCQGSRGGISRSRLLHVTSTGVSDNRVVDTVAAPSLL